MIRIILAAVLLTSFGQVAYGATTITGDITTNTTWNNAGSPYTLDPAGASGGTITVKNATLTVDTSGGAVNIHWNEDCDFKIGDGSSQAGTLVIQASSGAVNFNLKTGGNVRVANNGQLLWSDASSATRFRKRLSGDTWGAVIFESGQTMQSEMKNVQFSDGGADGKTAMLVVEDNEDLPPHLEDLRFSDQATSGVAAIRVNGKGVNLLKEGNFVSPIQIVDTNLDYAFYLSAVTSTVPIIRFPDVNTPASPVNYLSGTCSIGDSSNVSHWRFDDGYTFKCAASSTITTVNGTVWGTEESRPLFCSVSGSPGFTDWNGLQDGSSTKKNLFAAQMGAFAHLDVRDASYGIQINKGSALGAGDLYRISGINAKHCQYGMFAQTTSGVVQFESCTLGGATSTDWCSIYGAYVPGGVCRVERCSFEGSDTGTDDAMLFVGTDDEVFVEESRFRGPSAQVIFHQAHGDSSSLTISRTIIESDAIYGIRVQAITKEESTSAATLRLNHSAVYVISEEDSYGVFLDGDATSPIDALLEDCTLVGANRSLQGHEVKAGISAHGVTSQVLARRCNFVDAGNGVYLNDTANNTVEYTFEECFFGDNTNGINDARTQTARAVAYRCTFFGNKDYGALDASGSGSTTDMLAEDCYWGDDDGPDGFGPGNGDNVSDNVDFTPWLARSYIGWLIGGSPAGVSSLGVKESTAATDYADQLHLVTNSDYAVAWTFATDFEGLAQAAYEIEIDVTPDFSSVSLVHDGSQVTSGSSNVQIATSLTDGVVYYLRVRLTTTDGSNGPWYYHTFRLNDEPAKVGNTNRDPENNPTSPLTDWTPEFIWQVPSDATSDPLHFEVFAENPVPINYTVRSWTTSSETGNPTEFDLRSYFNISYDSGSSWVPMPADGAPSDTAILVRLIWPDVFGFSDTDWTWKVRAWDGFEFGTYADLWDFEVDGSFTISGVLNTNAGAALSGKTLRLYVNGTNSGDTDITGLDGSFDIVNDSGLKLGDVLWVYLDDQGSDTERCAAAFHFIGEDMDGVDLRDECAHIYGTLPGTAFSNDDFEILTADADIPWTYSGGTVTFKSSLDFDGDGNEEGVYLSGCWQLTGDVDGTTTLDTPLYIEGSGVLRTQSFDAGFYSVFNEGSLEILAESTFTINGANSTSSGTLIIDRATLNFAGSGSLTLTVDNGSFEARAGATIQDLTANVSTLVADSASAASPAVLVCANTTFDEVRVTIETDAVLTLFNDNTFQNDVSTQHVHWKSESPLSVSAMRGISFNTSVNGSSTFNVKATSTANNLTMIACGGIGQGEAYDDDGSNKVDWELKNPTGLRLTVGDTRILAEWDDSPQVDASAFGFNFYKSPLLDSQWTSAPSFGGGVTTFTDSSANFTSALIGLTFYPDAEAATGYTVNSVPSATTLTVSGNVSGSAANGDTYSFFYRVGGLFDDVSDAAESLTNGTTYHFYVSIDDSTEDAPAARLRSQMLSAAPAEADIEALVPSSAEASSILALSVLGEETHWDSSTTVVIEQNDGGGSSNCTVNDKVVISAGLILVDVTLSGASAEAWDVDVTASNVWGISAYDEAVTATLTVAANNDVTRPTIAFSSPSADADVSTAGTWTITVTYDDQGGTIDTASLELMASRDLTIQSTNRVSGINLSAISSFWDATYPNATTATCTVNNSSGTELFADGEYVLAARIANDNGEYSEWVTRRFYVDGAAANVVKVPDASGVPVKLYQGDVEVTISLSGSSLSASPLPNFGSNITVHSATVTGGGAGLDVVVSVDELAACGPREFTTNSAAKAGIVIVEYPTNILPTTTNAEPPRNPAIGGVNVFLTNGAFFKSETDIATRGRMMGMSWSRFYRSDIEYDGPLGHGWVGHYFQRAVRGGPGDVDIHWYTPDGRKEAFTIAGGAGFVNPDGVYVMAAEDTLHDTVTLTDRHGFQCVFNAQGRLWRCIDRNGNRTECTYNHVGQLVTITDDRGRNWDVTYGADGRVSLLEDFVWDDTTPREVAYTYDTDGNLIEQAAPETSRYNDTDGNRITYAYAYDVDHRLIRCINPREFNQSAAPIAYLENYYDSQGRVLDQKLGDEADVFDSHLTRSAFIRLRYNTGADTVHEVDRNGHRTDYTLDGDGHVVYLGRFTGFWSVDTDFPITHTTVTKVLDALRESERGPGGSPGYIVFQTGFDYNSNHEVTSIEYPRLNKVTYTYPSAAVQTIGTATSFPSALVLADTGQAWTPDDFIGMTLRVGSNPAEYRYYPIVDNDATTITVENDGFSLTGDGWTTGEDYEVYDQNNSPMAEGNVLTVTRSDEALGSLSDIVTSYTYEPRYQFVKTTTDARGEVTTYMYDYEASAGNGADAGNVVEVHSPDIDEGQTSTQNIISRTTYNEFGQPVTMTDGEGNVTYLTYFAASDANGRGGFLFQRISAWGELNLTSEYDYNPAGNLIAAWSPRAFESGATEDDFKSSYEVNELNQTWHVASNYEVGDSASNDFVEVDSYSYFDANGNLTQSFREYITDSGTPPSAPGDEDDPTTFSKSSSAMAATWVESSATYNLLNHGVTRTIDAIAGSAVTQYTSRVEYDSNYNVLASITPLGNRSHTVYDERNMVYQRIAGAESDVEGTYESDYDENGNLIASRDANTNETVYEYDGFDRTVLVTDAAGHYRTTEYDENSNVLESSAYDVFGVLLSQSTSSYDELNRAWKTQRLAQDHNGLAIGDGWATNTTVFDRNSRVVSSKDDNGVEHFNFYDAANRTTFTRDAVGNEAHYVYNAHGATTRINYREINGLSGAVEISHVEYILNRSDAVWEFRDRRWNEEFDTSGTTTYDGWGRVTRSEDAEGNGMTTNFDLLSRVIDTTQDAGSDAIETRYEYDDDGRTVLRGIKRNPSESTYQETQYEYDERSRLITLRRPDNDIWTYQYDPNGNQIEWLDPLGTRVTNTYDNRNQISYRYIDRGAGIVGITYESYEYDALGRPESSSNYEETELVSSTQWQYNTLGLPEVQTQHVARMTPLVPGSIDSFTVETCYDATGFVVGNINWDGRETLNTPDQLNRLLSVYDATDNKVLSVNLYAGPSRLIERTSGDGTRTSIYYEASGCGCGGSSSMVERVEHVDASGNITFANNRVYNTRGNCTAENADHWGTLGQVYVYDAAQRLTNAFHGIDLWEDSSNVNKMSRFKDDDLPSDDADGVRASNVYRLDPRGSRKAIEQWTNLSVQVIDDDYTIDADTNQYATVDGDSYAYDTIEQRTFDASTGLYSAYDYKGQLVATATDSNFSNVAATYDYDNQGRLLLEDKGDVTGVDADQTTSVNSCGAGGSCGCGGGGGNSGDPKVADIVADIEGNILNVTDYEYGSAVSAPGSSMTFSPLSVPGAGPAGLAGNAPTSAAMTLYAEGLPLPAERTYYQENPLGSLIGTTDASGKPTREVHYNEYGEPLGQAIRFSARPEDIDSVSWDPTYKETTITLTGTSAPAGMDGMEVRVAIPDDPDKRYRTARVQHGSGDTLVLWEPTDPTNTVAAAIEPIGGGGSIGAGFVVFENPNGMVDGRWDTVTFDGIYTSFHDNERNYGSDYVGKTFEFLMGIAGQTLTVDAVGGGNLKVLGDQTGSVSSNDRYRGPKLSGSGAEEETNSGFWWEDPTYAAGETTLVAEPSATFKSHQVGWRVCVNTQRPSYYTITGVSGSSLTVEGDLTSPLVAEAGDWFRVIAPYAVDSDTGKLPENPWPDTPRASLYAGYRYMPPEVGTPSGGEVQAGTNEKGRYHCFNRDYDPHTGSWTTSDPAASPWANLQDYCSGNLLSCADASGLMPLGRGITGGAIPDDQVETDANGTRWGRTGTVNIRHNRDWMGIEFDNVAVYKFGSCFCWLHTVNTESYRYSYQVKEEWGELAYTLLAELQRDKFLAAYEDWSDDLRDSVGDWFVANFGVVLGSGPSGVADALWEDFKFDAAMMKNAPPELKDFVGVSGDKGWVFIEGAHARTKWTASSVIRRNRKFSQHRIVPLQCSEADEYINKGVPVLRIEDFAERMGNATGDYRDVTRLFESWNLKFGKDGAWESETTPAGGDGDVYEEYGQVSPKE